MDTPIIPQKQCSKCKQFFDATTNYFETDNSKKDGLYPSCRTCKSIKVRYIAPEGFRRCTKCKETFPETIEYFRLYKKGTQFYAKCHVCERKHEADKKKANPEKYRNAQKRFRENNPERSKEIKQKWADNNSIYIKKKSARYYIENKDIVRARNNDYISRHPEKRRASSHKRRKLYKMADGNFSEQDLKMMYEEQEGRCAYCGISIYWHIPRDIHIDHIQPLSKGGSNWPANLALTCADCNLTKGNKTLKEWEAVRGW